MIINWSTRKSSTALYTDPLEQNVSRNVTYYFADVLKTGARDAVTNVITNQNLTSPEVSANLTAPTYSAVLEEV